MPSLHQLTARGRWRQGAAAGASGGGSGMRAVLLHRPHQRAAHTATVGLYGRVCHHAVIESLDSTLLEGPPLSSCSAPAARAWKRGRRGLLCVGTAMPKWTWQAGYSLQITRSTLAGHRASATPSSPLIVARQRCAAAAAPARFKCCRLPGAAEVIGSALGCVLQRNRAQATPLQLPASAGRPWRTTARRPARRRSMWMPWG